MLSAESATALGSEKDESNGGILDSVRTLLGHLRLFCGV